MGSALSPGGEFHSYYDLGRELGKGAQGRVYLCVDRRDGAERAVKIIDRASKSAWEVYRREVDMCREVSSACVVSVVAEFADQGSCYVVMEKYAGHIRKGLKFVAKARAASGGAREPVLPCRELRRIVRQVMGAVVHLHLHDIVHRDVKAHNIFMDRLDLRDAGCRVVLGDFGLARRLDQGYLLSAQVGTRKYWAPELYAKRYQHLIDVFAVGVLVFLAGCGSYPYATEEETLERNHFAEGPVAGLDEDAVDFLRLCLQKDPAERPSAKAAAAHAWLCPWEDESNAVLDAPRFGPRPSRSPTKAQVQMPQADEALSQDSSDFERAESALGVDDQVLGVVSAVGAAEERPTAPADADVCSVTSDHVSV